MKLPILVAIIALSVIALMLGVDVMAKVTDLTVDRAFMVIIAIIMVVVIVMVYVLQAMSPPTYTGPERRVEQRPTKHVRRASDVGHDVWGGPGRYTK